MKEKVRKIFGNKKNLTIIISLIVILLGTVIGVYAYNEAKEREAARIEAERLEKIENIEDEIEEKVELFETSENREDKIVIFEEVFNDSVEYSNSDEFEDEVVDFYNEKLDLMKTSLYSYYEENITLIKENVNEESKDNLNESIEKLNDLKSQLENEKEYDFYNEELSNSYSSKIGNLVESYGEKVKAIETKEEEERLAKEAAEKEAAEAAANASNNNSSNSSSGYSSNNNANSSSNYNNNSGTYRDPSSLYHHWQLDENGNKIEGSDTYTDHQGGVYDENGNKIGDVSEWIY